jgi:hypothetical protein
MRRFSALAVLVSAVPICVFGAGCYSTYVVPTAELTHLDGFRAPAPEASQPGSQRAPGDGEGVAVAGETPFRVQTSEGSSVEYDASEWLFLAPNWQVSRGGRFREIHVANGHFSGTLLDGTGLQADLKNIHHAELTRYDAERSKVATIVGISVGIIGAGLAAAVVAASAGP